MARRRRRGSGGVLRILVVLPGVGVLAAAGAHAASEPGPGDAAPAPPGPVGGEGVQPHTDVVVMDIQPHGDHLHVGSLIEASDREGYDNQPHFRDHDRVLFVSDRDAPGTDIYGFSVFEGAVVRLTDTPESEYSPRVTPDGEGFSVVRAEEEGGGGVQGLYVYPLDEGAPAGSEDARRLLEDVDDIGYYAWASDTEVALFRLGDPPSLHLADVETGEVRRIADDIGPTIQPIPGEDAVSFVDVSHEEAPTIRRLEAGSGEVSEVAPMPAGALEHAWVSPFNVLMGHEGILYRYPVDRAEADWIELEDLGATLGPFDRIAVSPEQSRIAVVVERED